MSQNLKERFGNRVRVLPPVHIPAENEPPIPAKREKGRSVKRPFSINTPVTDDHYTLLVRLSEHFRRKHGRSWRGNDTIEAALEALANRESVPLPWEDKKPALMSDQHATMPSSSAPA